MSEPKCPGGFYQFEGVSPTGDSRAWFLVAKDAYVGHLDDTTARAKALEGFFVAEICQRPSGTWINLKRPEKEEALCYAGIPSGRYLVEGGKIEVPFVPGYTLVVYISGRTKDGQYKITDWERIPSDPEHPGFPPDHLTRFGRRLWPKD